MAFHNFIITNIINTNIYNIKILIIDKKRNTNTKYSKRKKRYIFYYKNNRKENKYR